MVTSKSPRTMVEVLVAHSAQPLPDISSILPEREVGPLAPRGDPGRPLEPGPLPERFVRAERRARVDGAAAVSRVTMRASPAGDGTFVLQLGDGCHRVVVLAEIPTAVPRRATDIDAEARDPLSDRMLVRDRGEAPDARLEFLFG